MPQQLRLSMRWWLALAFASIAALTSLVVTQVLVSRSEASIRDRAGELAAGSAVAAASRIAEEETPAGIREATAGFSARRMTALFVFDRNGNLLTPAVSLGVDVNRLPNRDALVKAALSGRRLVAPLTDGRRVTVALPLRDAGDNARALVAVVSRPDLVDALGIVRAEVVSAAVWATFAGAISGLGIAVLITRRIRRIASAATAIEEGQFDVDLSPRFRDEVGGLAETVARMGKRLSASFEQLESDRNRLGRLLEQLHEGVIAVDDSLIVEFANSRASALTESALPPGEPLLDPWQSTSLRAIARGLFAPGAESVSARFHPDPSRTYLISALPPSSESGSAVLVLVDATEAERRERAEREFVTNAAHELRTPLTAISSAVEVLQSGAKDDPARQDQFLAAIARQTSRLGGLVHALLTLARVETGSEDVRLEPVDLKELFREIADEAATYGVEVDVAAPKDATVLGHRELLRLALTNLVTNAATHGEGRDLRLHVYPSPMGGTRIEVSDRGPGMPQNDADRIFDRFYRSGGARTGGYGLGLSIVSAAIAAMGGSVSATSNPRQGTTVVISLGKGTGTGA